MFSLHFNSCFYLFSSSDTNISDHSQLSCANHNKQTISTNDWRHPNDNGKFVEWKHQMSQSKRNTHHLRYGPWWRGRQPNHLSFWVSSIRSYFGNIDIRDAFKHSLQSYNLILCSNFLHQNRSPAPTFTTVVDNVTKQQVNYTLELRTTFESYIESMDQNYTLYSVNWSEMAKLHKYLLFRINIWTYSFILKFVPSIILTVITGFLIKGKKFNWI